MSKENKDNEPIWFDTLPPVPESEKPKIDKIIHEGLEWLRKEVEAGRVKPPPPRRRGRRSKSSK